MKNDLIIALCLSFFAFSVLQVLFPEWCLIYFAPFLVLASYRWTLGKLLWIGALCGLFIDFFTNSHFGLYACCYALTVIPFFHFKKFFNDKIFSLCLAIASFSIFFSLIECFLVAIFERKIVVSSMWLLSDVICMSFLDAIYGALAIILPLRGIKWLKRYWIYFRMEGEE